MKYEIDEQSKNNLLIFLTRVKFDDTYKNVIAEIQELQKLIQILNNPLVDKIEENKTEEVNSK